MNKEVLILLLLFLITNIKLCAQRAFDGECIIGTSGRIMSFDSVSAPTLSIPSNDFYLYTHGASSIADSNGKLILACSNYTIADRNGDSILGGGGVNLGKIIQWSSGWRSYTQQSIILPKGNSEYYVFTTRMSDNSYDLWDNNQDFVWDMLTYHIVDMKENNGLGKVTYRDQVLVKDKRLSHNRMTAVKHANGRDWWLIKPHQTKAIFYKFLVSSDKIEGPFEQQFNFPEMDSYSGLWGQSTFNRTGDMYAYCAGSSYGVYVLNFDRCSGNFSPYYFYPIERDTSYSYDYMIGTCFSPDGKLLYANTSYQIYQMELSDTIASSIQLIHGPDDTTSSFAEYANINLGPDNKLYIGNLNGTRSTISYINEPNERGLACNFCNQCLVVPNNNAKGLPNMPYYHLGVLEGSPCDSLIPKPPETPSGENVYVYPNPFNNEIKVFLPVEVGTKTNIVLYNILGQRIKVWTKDLNATQRIELDIGELARDIYILKVEAVGRTWNVKIRNE